MAATFLHKAGYSLTVAALVAFSSSTPAAPLTLPDAPLFLGANVEPNLIMAIDDSGSMDNETLFPGNDGAAWWRRGDSGTCSTSTRDSFVGCVSDALGTTDQDGAGRLNFNNAGNANNTWKKYVYLFPNGSGAVTTARRRSGDGDNDHFAIPPLLQFAWSRSPAFNKAYFNPASTYTPWVDGGGFTFNDSPPTAARYDAVFPLSGTIDTVDLTRDIAGDGNTDTGTDCSAIATNRADNFYFKVYSGMTIPVDACIRVASYGGNPSVDVVPTWQKVTATCTVGTNNGCTTARANGTNRFTLRDASRVAIRYFPATFYLPSGTALPVDYGFNGTTIAGGKAPNGADLVGYEIKPGNFSSTTAYNTAIQNFANWFTYYRKRHQALRAGLGESFNTVGGIRVDGFTINNAGVNVDMKSIDDAAARTALYTKFYQTWQGSGGTPNRTAVASMITNYRRTGASAPITSACQKNFGMLFTDGFSNAPDNNDGLQNYNNADQNAGQPYADGVSDTMADATFTAYKDLLPNNGGFDPEGVPVAQACDDGTTAARPLDCNRNLHMNFYAVTLGTKGLLFDSANPIDPYANPPTWPTSFPTRHPSAVDDIWHATINGRGKLLNAQTPQDISTQLKAVLETIKKEASSAASASVNSGTISSDTRVFQATFQSSGWTGELRAFAVDSQTGQLVGGLNPDNTPRDDVWKASEKVPAPALRNIFTKNSAGVTVPFTWNGLRTDAVRSGQLAATPAAAELMVNYLRGDPAGEINGTFREREEPTGRRNVLGDIISSAPLFVGAPPFRYRDSLDGGVDNRYSSFATSNANRAGVVYVGANDGMLHAFSAATGAELFAYIPSVLFPKLKDLSAPTYAHQFFVDASPSMGDAYITRGGNTAWRTVLVGGLNKGGQGIYALDVTDPGALNATAVMWEFTDANDVDLGYTFSQPSIVRLRNGKWVAVFGNGYNSTQPTSASDTRVSTTGNAVLYIVDLANGALLKKLDTGVGRNQAPTGIAYDNGLSTPALVDVDGDRITDYAYAGDLYGNMWKFDLTSATDAGWTVAFNTQPLYTARHDNAADSVTTVQPITARPEVARGPDGDGVIVLFGTGKYLEASDRRLPPLVPQTIQSFYGIFDSGSRVVITDKRAAVLTRQTIDFEGSIDVLPDQAGGDFDARVTSNNPLGTGTKGWYLDLRSPSPLPYTGERQVTNAIVRNGAVIFTTLIPDSKPCGAGGSSWLMELDLIDGSRLETPPFDLNGDGNFDNRDNPTVTIPGVGSFTGPISGLTGGTSQGIQAAPGVLVGERNGKPIEYKYLTGTGGRIQIRVEDPRKGATGRQSWRQVR